MAVWSKTQGRPGLRAPRSDNNVTTLAVAREQSEQERLDEKLLALKNALEGRVLYLARHLPNTTYLREREGTYEEETNYYTAMAWNGQKLVNVGELLAGITPLVGVNSRGITNFRDGVRVSLQNLSQLAYGRLDGIVYEVL